jgi:hypothetical protein
VYRLLPALLLCAASSALAGGGHSLTVSAVVPSKNNCRFSGAGSTLSLSVDPAGGAAVAASTSLSIRCLGSSAVATWSLSANSGLYGVSPAALRMRHGTNLAEFLPYVLSFPASGSVTKNVWQDITVTATVAAADYQNARPGAYSDTVALSLLP